MNSAISTSQGNPLSPSNPAKGKTGNEPTDVGMEEISRTALASATSRKRGHLVKFDTSPLPLAGANFGAASKSPQIIAPDDYSIKVIEILRLIQVDFCSADVSQAAANAQRMKDELEEAHRKTEENQKQIDAENAKIAKKSEADEIGSQILAVFGVLMGIVMIIGTAGAALALGVVMLAVSLYSAVVSFIPPECLPERKDTFGNTVKWDLSISGLVGYLCELTVSVEGGSNNGPVKLSRQQFEDWKTGWSFAVNILIVLPSLIYGGAQLAKVLQKGLPALAASTSKSLIQIFFGSRAAAALGGVAAAGQIITSVTSIGFSIARIFLAGAKKDLAWKEIQKEDIQKIITELETQFDLNHQYFQNGLAFQETLRKTIAVAIANHIEQSVRITKNCA